MPEGTRAGFRANAFAAGSSTSTTLKPARPPPRRYLTASEAASGVWAAEVPARIP